MDPAVRRAIAATGQDAWASIRYTDAIFDETTSTWISGAEVAEIDFTAFTSRKKSERVPGRLMVPRIPGLNTHKHQGQPTLFQTWRSVRRRVVVEPRVGANEPRTNYRLAHRFGHLAPHRAPHPAHQPYAISMWNDWSMDMNRCVFHMRNISNEKARELLPLSALQESDPESYAQALAKYDDTPERRRLPGTRIPCLDALWTEVVFLSPITPHAVWTAWAEARSIEAGKRPLPAQEFWAIPVDDIGEAVLLDRTLTATGEEIDPREVSRLNPDTYISATVTTPGNAAWARELTRKGVRGGYFHRTPHVLTRGPVSLERSRLVDWSVTPLNVA